MPDPTPRPPARATSLRPLALLALVAALPAIASISTADPPAAKGKETLVGGAPLFDKWPANQKPDAVIVFTGQTFGLLQPCGCSRPQTGGLERRAYFIDTLKAKGWPVAGIDLGDLYPEKIAVRDQGRLKYIATMNALREMGYIAVGVGKTDLAGGLDTLLGAYVLQKEQPPYTLAGNAVGLDNKGQVVPRLKRFPVTPGDTRPLIGLTEVADVGAVPVGVAGVVGKALKEEARAEKFDPSIDFDDTGAALKAAVAEFGNAKKKPQLTVLIYQGGSADAQKLAQDFPQFNVILCQATPNAPPPLMPVQVAGKFHPPGQKTLVVEVGHKGQHVGVLGAFKNAAGGLDLKYQLVPMGEEFITPGTDDEARKKNKTLDILETYAKSVKAEIDLAKDYRRDPHPAQIHAQGLNPKVNLTYVGSDACQACHVAEHAQWAKTPHGHALDALENIAKRPSLRQFDGECVKCHVVGFEHQTGYQDEKKTPHLKHVGCESCHGPGSGHVANPKNKQLTELLSLWKQGIVVEAGKPPVKMPDNAFMEKMAKLGPEERGKEALAPAVQLTLNLVGGACMKCHDQDNDPHFDIYKYWPKVNHSGLAPKEGWPAVAPKK